jgi:hypothetical protein
MKKIVKCLTALCVSSCVASLSTLSAFAIYKTDYERAFGVWTYSSAYAPDQISTSADVTLPSTASKIQFYCYYYQGNKSAKTWVSSGSLVSGSNEAYLTNQGIETFIPLKSNWITLNGGSRIVGFYAALVNPVESSNCIVSSVAY